MIKAKLILNNRTYATTDEPANVFSPAFDELARIEFDNGAKGILYQNAYSQKLAVGFAHLSIADPLFAVYLTLERSH